jgi:hypothetical protein
MTPGMPAGMGTAPPLTEQQRRILEMIAQMQGGGQQYQVPGGYNVAQNMAIEEPLRLNQQNGLMAGLGNMPTPRDMTALPEQSQQSPADFQGLMDAIGNSMPAGDTFQRGNYITGVDDPRFKRPMSTGYQLRPNLGFPAY